jgi:hypothetical protein
MIPSPPVRAPASERVLGYHYEVGKLHHFLEFEEGKEERHHRGLNTKPLGFFCEPYNLRCQAP